MTIYESFSSLARTFRGKEELFRGPLWVTNLKEEKFRLIGHGINNDSEDYHSFELYQHRFSPDEIYARINLFPKQDSVPTVILGKSELIDRYARHDKKIAEPLPPELFERLNKIKLLSNIFKDVGKLSYYLRPSSFALCEVDIHYMFNQEIKLTIMRYMLGGKRNGDFFAHIHTQDEEIWLFPNYCRALLITNSSAYIKNHPEHNYYQVDFQQIQQAVYNGLII